MAKRKPARATRRKSASSRRGAARGRSASRKAASRKRTAKKKTPVASTRRSAKKAPRKAAKATARKRATRRPVKARSKSTAARTSARSSAPRSAKRRRAAVTKVPPRTAPAGLNRARRTIADDDVVPTPPSSLDLDRSASAARTGRREMLERFEEHTETSPALTGGDVDADWESAYSVGDEAPGGDNPTPDQDIVDDIGHAMGVEYQDNEELKGEAKISKRDKNRWELDPASSDDWDER
ncbi:MAG TPA: DUF6335 family protein [Vicinamibacterales bacterium]|nr:DUF6335 family protein [Vicinamibacterales bacterium]